MQSMGNDCLYLITLCVCLVCILGDVGGAGLVKEPDMQDQMRARQITAAQINKLEELWKVRNPYSLPLSVITWLFYMQH